MSILSRIENDIKGIVGGGKPAPAPPGGPPAPPPPAASIINQGQVQLTSDRYRGEVNRGPSAAFAPPTYGPPPPDGGIGLTPALDPVTVQPYQGRPTIHINGVPIHHYNALQQQLEMPSILAQ